MQIHRIMQKVIRNLLQSSTEEQSPHDSLRLNDQNAKDRNVRASLFKAEEVSFFDSHLAVSYSVSNFIIIKKDMYF